MSGKFDQVPKGTEATTLFQQEAELRGLDVLYECWIWEGIKAECVIFRDEDVCDLSDDEILEMVRSSPICRPDSKMTLRRSISGYTFANFNFTVMNP